MRCGYGIFTVFLLAACGTTPPAPAPEPRIITVDVPTIVQRGCPDQRPPREAYPDTKEKLALIPENDYEQLFRVARAGRDARDRDLALAEVQIKGCQ